MGDNKLVEIISINFMGDNKLVEIISVNVMGIINW